MTERQAQAYLLARDAIRRIRRMSTLVGESLNRPAPGSGAITAGGNASQGRSASAR